MKSIKTFEDFLNEGLESMVDQIISDKKPELEGAYHWEYGMCVADEADAKELISILNASKEFGRATYNKKEGKIEFAKY
jgi:hypothetical protein